MDHFTISICETVREFNDNLTKGRVTKELEQLKS